MEHSKTSIPRRILMTADTVGGVWTYAVELCRSLVPYDVRVALAAMGAPLRPDQRTALKTLPNVDLFESSYKLEWMEEPWGDVAEAGEWLLEIERQYRPDVVHLNGYAHGSLPWQAPVLTVAHSCVYTWFESVRGDSPGATWSRYHEEVSRGLTRADVVTAPTAAMLQALARIYGPFKAGPIVFNGRRAEDYRPHQKEPMILAAGRIWDEAKNIGVLNAIAPRLSWAVYIAGEDRHPDTGRGTRYENAIPLGHLTPSALADWMGRASIYVLPARYEPFGLSALEAALAGCALVLGDIPSLREVWGDSAVFVQPDDAEALHDALVELISDPPMRERIARRVRERALQFTPERMAQGYLDLYKTLVKRDIPCPV